MLRHPVTYWSGPLQGPAASVRVVGGRWPRPEARPERARGEEDGVLQPIDGPRPSDWGVLASGEGCGRPSSS